MKEQFNRRKQDENNHPISSFKVVSLIAAIVTILACFVGAVTWISVSMANNAVSVETLNSTMVRHELLINKNTEIISQHAQLLTILKEHSKSIDILTNFMTKGGRFTEADGEKVYKEIDLLKEKIGYYTVLETELKWIKSSISRMETKMDRKLDELSIQMQKRDDELNEKFKENKRLHDHPINLPNKNN